MRIIDAGISGRTPETSHLTWEGLKLAKPWPEVIRLLAPGTNPRPVQAAALGTYRMLEGRRNFLISAPTNSGKSLIGLLAMLDGVRHRRRAVLLEPLRAIAREQADELTGLSSKLSNLLSYEFGVRITTGDYRLETETFSAPPPEQGEIIICTPERLEAIMRNPEHETWVRSIGVICFDEAHLISSDRRGPTLEYLLTSFLCLPSPPRLVLLSASFGDVSQAQRWLTPCDVVKVEGRKPPLKKEVVSLDDDENADEVVSELAREALSTRGESLLIFVYQTKAAERLASLLSQTLGDLVGNEGALAYHAGMSADRRTAVRHSFLTGMSRCVVSTTALALGVNLPATHVIVRDPTFVGNGPLSVADILQMMGRAGRGDRSGNARVIVRPRDGWKPDDLALALRAEHMPPLISSFEIASAKNELSGRVSENTLVAVATQVAAQLARRPESGCTVSQLQMFFERSLGGGPLAEGIPTALSWLTDYSKSLAFRDENQQYRLTALGLTATHAFLPLPFAGGLAQLLRDIFSVDPADGILANWRILDHLVVLEILTPQPLRLRPFSRALVEQVDRWMEGNPARVSTLYREWIVGSESSSRANELLGSLGISDGLQRGGQCWAWKAAYTSVFRAIILEERGRGMSLEDIRRRWDVENLEGIEERWRDTNLWLLSGMAKILDLRCFYFHLRQECAASDDRIRRVKSLLRDLRNQAFQLMGSLKYCSPLGTLLHSIQRSSQSGAPISIGLRSIRRLEEAGVTNFAQLSEMGVDDLVRMGLRHDLAKQLRSYVRRRLEG
jgi:superfamily II DNA/RNA helicase